MMNVVEPTTVALFAIEFPEQIELAIDRVDIDAVANPVFLALNPDVSYALQRRNIDYVIPEDYYTEEELNVLGCELLDRLDAFVLDMDSLVRCGVPAIVDRQLDLGAIFWYEMKLCINSMAVKTHIFLRILKRVEVAEVYYFHTEDEPIDATLRFLYESVWSLAIDNVCRQRGVRLYSLGKGESGVTNYAQSDRWRLSGREKLKAIIAQFVGPEKVIKVKEACRRLDSMWQGFSRTLSNRGVERPCVLALDIGYSLSETLRLVEKRYRCGVFHLKVALNGQFDLFHLRNTKLGLTKCVANSRKNFSLDRDRVEELWDNVETLPSYCRLAKIGDIDLRPVLRRRYRYLIEKGVALGVNIYDLALILFGQLKPRALLGATVTWASKILFHAARSVDLPTIVYRHGSSAGYVMMESVAPFIHYQNELRWADYVFTFGEGDNRYYERHYPHKRARTIAIGSAELDRLRTRMGHVSKEQLKDLYGLDPSCPIVMYCPTSMDGNIRGIPYRSRSPERAFLIEKAIADTFRGFPEIQCIFKIHTPDRFWPVSPICSYIRDEDIRNCVVLNNKFTDLVPIADFFITDYPSTTFLEMLTTERPILLCGHLLPFPFGPNWHPSQLAMWQERVEYGDTLEKFITLLRENLTRRKFDPVVDRDTLLHQFGTHEGNGKSAERAVEKIGEIAGLI